MIDFLIDLVVFGVPAFVAGHLMNPWIDDKLTPESDGDWNADGR